MHPFKLLQSCEWHGCFNHVNGMVETNSIDFRDVTLADWILRYGLEKKSILRHQDKPV